MIDPCEQTLYDQLLAYRAALVAYNAAILAVGVGGVSSYQLDTGQTRQLVTKLNLATMRETVGWLLEQIDMLEGILGRTTSTRVVPGF